MFFKKMGIKTSCNTLSEQTFTKQCQQMLFKHFMYTTCQTLHDECLKTFPA